MRPLPLVRPRSLRAARLRVAALALFSLPCAPLAAQARPDTLPADTTLEIEGIRVRGTRAATAVGGAGAVTVAPDSLPIPPAASLQQALRTLPFVHLRENSRGEAELSVRGSESRQVAVLVDGVPLTLGWDHRTDPSLVPVSGARAIRVVRGLSSVLHGPNVLGGVVEVSVAGERTARETGGTLELRSEVDHLGARALSLAGGVAGGELAVRAGAAYRGRAGVALPAGVEERGRLRGNSDLEQLNAFASVRYDGTDGAWAGLSASGYRAERGVPPELHLASPRFWRYPGAARALAALSAGTGERGTPWGAGDLEASLGVDAGASEVESFRSAAYREVVGRESSQGRTLTLRLLGDHSLGPRGELRGAFTLAEVRHREAVDGAPALSYRQRLWSLGAETAWRLSAGVRGSGGVALDGADTPESGDKPPLGELRAVGGRLGVSALVAGEALQLHASFSSRARFPALRELYSGSLGRFVPNPGLRPERLLGAEAGATLHRGGVEAQAVLFHHRLEDAIVRAAAGGGRFRRENRDEVRSTGVELLAGWRGRGAELLTDLALQRVRVLDPSAPAGARRPEHTPGVRWGADLSVPLPLELLARGALRLTGRQHCVHPELGRDVALGSSLRADLGVARGWVVAGKALRGTLALDNATDAAVFDQCGLPQAGRTLRVGMGVRL